MFSIFDLFISAVICEALDARKEAKQERELERLIDDVDFAREVREEEKKGYKFYRVAGLMDLSRVTPYFLSYEGLFNYCNKELIHINGLSYQTQRKDDENVQ